MLGAGSILAMVQSVKMNLAQKRSNRYGKAKALSSSKPVRTEYNFVKVSPQKLAIIKNKIRKRASIRNKKELILFIIILASLSILATILQS